MKYILSLVTSLILIFYTFGIYAQGQEQEDTVRIAHRGAASYAPENTFAAFDEAIDKGADFIELDIQMSKDHELVVIHDLTVDRTTNGSGLVKDYTLQQFKSLDAGSWFNKKYKQSKIPTLNEVFLNYKGKVGFLIDIKYPDQYPGIEKKIIKLIKKYFSTKELHDIKVQSFNKSAIKKFHALHPTISTGIVLNSFPSILELYNFKKYGSFINIEQSFLTHSLIELAHFIGLDVLVWTVNNEFKAYEYILLGVDGIVADSPEITLFAKQ